MKFSPQSIFIPNSSSVKLALKEDVVKLLYFDKFSQYHFHRQIHMVLLTSLVLASYAVTALFLSSPLSGTHSITKLFIYVTCPLILFLIYAYRSYRKHQYYISNELFDIWIIEQSSVVHGYIWCAKYNSYVFVINILIRDESRNHGLGSYLINFIADTYQRPIYLSCNTLLKKFYYRNGFVDVNDINIPSELSRLRGDRNNHTMLRS